MILAAGADIISSAFKRRSYCSLSFQQRISAFAAFDGVGALRVWLTARRPGSFAYIIRGALKAPLIFVHIIFVHIIFVYILHRCCYRQSQECYFPLCVRTLYLPKHSLFSQHFQDSSQYLSNQALMFVLN